MKSYIYVIQNILTGASYVGKANNVERRWMRHKGDYKKCEGYLYRAMRHYGIENFEIRIVDSHEDEEYVLNVLESAWICKLRNEGIVLYNLTNGGDGLSGHKHSAETIKKMSDSQRGRPVSNEVRQKIAASLLGRQPSEEARRKISEAHRGKSKPPRSSEHCQRLSDVAKARGPMSNEQKTKISESMRKSENVGHPIDEATRQKIAEALREQVQSEETRAKRAESMRKAWVKRKANSQIPQV